MDPLLGILAKCNSNQLHMYKVGIQPGAASLTSQSTQHTTSRYKGGVWRVVQMSTTSNKNTCCRLGVSESHSNGHVPRYMIALYEYNEFINIFLRICIQHIICKVFYI